MTLLFLVTEQNQDYCPFPISNKAVTQRVVIRNDVEARLFRLGHSPQEIQTRLKVFVQDTVDDIMKKKIKLVPSEYGG